MAVGGGYGVRNLVDFFDTEVEIEHLELLLPNSRDYIEYATKVRDYFTYFTDVEICGVAKVNNNVLQILYNIKKEEYMRKYHGRVRELELFHSTSSRNAASIVEHNFDWTKVVRHRFGKGTSFSSDADYANCHANRRNGKYRAMIISKVLVGRRAVGHMSTIEPPPGFDTTGDPAGRVFVKYDDNEFIPTFVVFYNCPRSLVIDSKYYIR